jgi:hypothetical protein
MDAEPARLIIEALKEEKIDLYVTLPEEPTASLTGCNAVQRIRQGTRDGRGFGFRHHRTSEGELGRLNFAEFVNQIAARFLLTSGHGSGIFS